MNERDYLEALYKEHLAKTGEIPTKAGFKKPKVQEYYAKEYACKRVAQTISQEKMEEHIKRLSRMYPRVTGKPYKYCTENSNKTLISKLDMHLLREAMATKDYKHIHGKGYDNDK